MKFVYFGYDFMLPALMRLTQEGHKPLAVFSFPCDSVFSFNHECQNFAKTNDIPFNLEKPSSADILRYIDQGCTCFCAAGYLFKIPPIPEKAYGLNLHPSLLPKGRGLMPSPHILMNHPEASGVTIHKLADKFDTGDILMQKELTLNENEDVETLTARIAMIAPAMLSSVFSDIESYWEKAQPQNEDHALYFPPPDDDMRSFDWSATTDDILKKHRAFGRYGTLGHINDDLYVIYNLAVWKEKHQLKPGEIACIQSREIVIAAADGFVCIKEADKIIQQ